MIGYVIRRLLMMIPMLFMVSLLTFIIIQLPPGDFLNSLVIQMSEQGTAVDPSELAALRAQYGLDQPFYMQYLLWISHIVFHGDFGMSFEWNRPVRELVLDRIGMTVVLALLTLIAVWLVALPVGILSAIKRKSAGSRIANLVAFLGLATPDFVVALVLMYLSLNLFGQSVGGLFSPEFMNAPWSLAAVADLISHLWIPIIAGGAASAASLIRIMRANLLDEINKPYVVTQRAMGHSEAFIILRYPLRVALNPFVGTIGWLLPGLVSGATISAIVLNLATTGPMLLRALLSQDMYLAGGIILLLSTLTMIGTLISDLLLAWLDPRVRL